MSEMFHKVAQALLRRGFKATTEYPGFVSVELNDNQCWNFGTANQNWGGDRVSANGAIVHESLNLSFPKDHQSDGEDIADAIVRTMVGSRWKSKAEIALRILQGGGELTVSSGHVVVMQDNRLYVRGQKQTGVSGPMEDVLLGIGDWSFDSVIREFEEMRDDELFLKAAALVLKEKTR